MKSAIPFLFIGLLITSCSEDDDSTKPSNPDTPAAAVDLAELEHGQKSSFIKYKSTCGLADSFEFTGDTLIVEVKEDNGALMFHESYTDGSSNLSGMEPTTHQVVQKDGYILIPERFNSQLFFFYGNDTIFTHSPHDVELSQGLCFVQHENGEPFIGEEIGRITSFNIGEVSVGENKIVSCVPPILDLNAYLIYNENRLVVSHTINDNLLQLQMDGFRLIEN